MEKGSTHMRTAVKKSRLVSSALHHGIKYTVDLVLKMFLRVHERPTRACKLCEKPLSLLSK